MVSYELSLGAALLSIALFMVDSSGMRCLNFADAPTSVQFALLPLFHLFLIFQVTVGLGQKKNFSVSPTEPVWIEKIITSDKKPALKDITDGYYLFLYEQQNNLETQEQYEHYIRDIVSDNGVQNGSQISVTYDPTYQKLTFHKCLL